MTAPRLVSVLTENWTMTDPRDLRSIVRMAQEAEDAGFDMVMVSDHVLLDDAMRARLGETVRYTAPEPLGAASIRYFALAVGDLNPLYLDVPAHGPYFGAGKDTLDLCFVAEKYIDRKSVV